jgi:hypothetical protein
MRLETTRDFRKSSSASNRKQFAKSREIGVASRQRQRALHVAAVEAAVHSLSSIDLGCQRYPSRIISSLSGLLTSLGTVTGQWRMKAVLCN